MTINNHLRIGQLENQLKMEQARVIFLEDFSSQLHEKVGKLEMSMKTVKTEVGAQKKNMTTILAVVKLLSSHQAQKQKQPRIIEQIRKLFVGTVQNTLIFGIIHVLMKVMWIDSLIDTVSELLAMVRVLSKKSIERSKILVKLSISIALFALLRQRIKDLLQKLKATITILT